MPLGMPLNSIPKGCFRLIMFFGSYIDEKKLLFQQKN